MIPSIVSSLVDWDAGGLQRQYVAAKWHCVIA